MAFLCDDPWAQKIISEYKTRPLMARVRHLVTDWSILDIAVYTYLSNLYIIILLSIGFKFDKGFVTTLFKMFFI